MEEEIREDVVGELNEIRELMILDIILIIIFGIWTLLIWVQPIQSVLGYLLGNAVFLFAISVCTVGTLLSVDCAKALIQAKED